MGKLRGTVNVAWSNYKSNKRNAFIHGLRVFKPAAILCVFVAAGLSATDAIADTDFLQTTLYTVSIYAFRWRTLIQLAPLIDQFTPGILRLIGLGTLLNTIVGIGVISIALSWLWNQ